MQKNRLWTKDFTIITLGTIISMLGNSMSGFAIGVMVLDYTDSVFLYALFSVIYSAPMIICPIFAGPLLDAIPRKKAIYTLDFISAFIFVLLSVCLYFDMFNYPLFAFMAFLIGGIDSIYMVAYDSLYPNLVSEGNMSKAYSISSMIYPLASLMVPVAAYIYGKWGLTPIFLFNAVSFLIAAVFETQIKVKETHSQENHEKSFKRYRSDFREGIEYIKSEKGLMSITAYFFVTMLLGSAAGTLVLPYFKATESLGVQLYTFVMGAALIWRLAGGGFHYLKKLPAKYKFLIALCVYFSISVIEGVYLYLPIAVMIVLNFFDGALGVTSYNIRISATQNYIPDAKRARFNGVFQMILSFGGILGQLIAGGLGDYIPSRPLIAGFMGLNIFAVIFIMAMNAKHVSKIYNVDI